MSSEYEQLGQVEGTDAKKLSKKEKKARRLYWLRVFLSETIGTTLLLFVLASSVDLIPTPEGKGFIAGITVYSLLAMFGAANIVGFNPAISIALLLFKEKNDRMKIVVGLAGQFVGMLLASALLSAFLSWFDPFLGVPYVDPAFGKWRGFFIEIFGVSIIVHAALSSYNNAFFAEAGAMSIAIPVALLCNLTGASLNPYRYLVSVIFVGFTNEWWLYLLTPFLGMFMACGIYYVTAYTPKLSKLAQSRSSSIGMRSSAASDIASLIH